MRLIHDDFWRKTLVIPWMLESPPVEARVRVRQPQGFVQEWTTRAISAAPGEARVHVVYPLMDDGRYDPSHATWNGAWEMGEYLFQVCLSAADGAQHLSEMSLDPHAFFPRDKRGPVAVDSSAQFIECAPRSPLYLNADEASFLIRVRRHRVSSAAVVVDVAARGGERVLAGPWPLRLGHAFHEQPFDTAGWPSGEYWIRVRALWEGEPAGPYCVRKFWIQATKPPRPPVFIDLSGRVEALVDDFVFARTEGVQFVPDPFEKAAGPLVTPTAPHEEEMLAVESIEWNGEARRFECVYANNGGRIDRKDTEPQREHLKMLAVSPDGRAWSKPSLRRVCCDGGGDNNILRDDTAAPLRRVRHHDTPKSVMDHDIEHAEFRFYDPQRDGPVNLDNVLVASGKRYFPFECRSLRQGASPSAQAAEQGAQAELRPDGLGVLAAAGPGDGRFRPGPGEFWPFEKRGDLYLALTRQPVLYLGVGMDLMHATERIWCHVERTGRRRLFWYFRPGAPAYPPHGAPCDNMNMALRCMAVLWTDDGLTYHRQFVLGPDDLDRIGTQFYDMGLLQRFGTSGEAEGRPVLDRLVSGLNQAFPPQNLYLGMALLHWGIEQTQAPELIWTRDLLHFHRFRQHRRPQIELGAGGEFDAGMIRPLNKYHAFDGEWWHHYTGVNTRHNGYGVMARFRSLDELRQAFPNHADAPYFTTWEGAFAEGKATKYLPGVARSKPFRVAHAEPVDSHARLLTRPLRVDGDNLLINARTQPGGSLTVRLLGGDGRDLGRPPFVFQGDETSALVADLTPWRGSLITIEFDLRLANLYAFQIAPR